MQLLGMHKNDAQNRCTKQMHKCTHYLQITTFGVSACSLMTLVGLLALGGLLPRSDVGVSHESCVARVIRDSKSPPEKSHSERSPL
jgi:hypothetical protein